MSHRIKSATVLPLEDSDIVKESLVECWGEDYNVIENTTIRGVECDFGVTKKTGHAYSTQVMGLERNEETGKYELVTYNNAVGNSKDQKIVDDTMSKVYTSFAAKKVKKVLASQGITSELDEVVDSELEIDGVKTPTKMVRVKILSGIKRTTTTNVDGDTGNLDGGI